MRARGERQRHQRARSCVPGHLRARVAHALHGAGQRPQAPDRKRHAHGHGQLVDGGAGECEHQCARGPGAHQHQHEGGDARGGEPASGYAEQQRRQARGERGAAGHHRDAAGKGGPGQKVERKVEHQGGQHAKVHVIRSVVIGAIPQVVLARSINHLLALGAVIEIVELSHPCRRVCQQRCPPRGEGSRQLEVAVGGVGVLVDVLYGERGRRGPLFQIRLVVETGGDAGVCGLGEEDGRAAQDEDERYARGCEPEQAGVLRRGCAKGAASADDERECVSSSRFEQNVH